MDDVECQHCFEVYPVNECHSRCPSCGVKAGADGRRHGRIVKESLRKYRDSWD